MSSNDAAGRAPANTWQSNHWTAAPGRGKPTKFQPCRSRMPPAASDPGSRPTAVRPVDCATNAQYVRPNSAAGLSTYCVPV
ncbi:MAG: hypothetical protein COZ06_20625 [Armatimonadetes bacterium CG_4_10_14_3_um_filter_66_18]|nr:hypothetical protein [Armatimonadota bacterium]OIP04473.1 MAG: hypothetical protein AUJ96_12680 [Armatimonadetes bacterium CG2_30_66_41]PIU95585.1 MAG: hypothetical protein COS65_01765 [Armatimonadetes bacterium CG06_land_8_20_14_3_00_66_21]PIX47302.1 MAG: hypothetical protein COZ57_08820 [Armatimonadetes bacterium CG_4_8_14_3_um_filter_66_20]PIY44448.1 MAG: hypothetical protein COZ06_20625 [Armatimonadetes bacterium CG_4_10_14_3_um_filter_66_18]PJB74321.1 MAG: hypothetical protein CO096_03